MPFYVPTRRRWNAAAALAALAVVSPVAAQTPGVQTLSLPEAVALASESNPEFLQQRNDLQVASASVRQAWGGLLPSASASSSFGYQASGERRFQSVELGEQPDYLSSSYNLSLNYSLDGSALLQPRVERARRTATERQVRGAEANLESQVAQRYLEVLRTRAQVEQARREIERTAEHVRLAQARLEVGVGTSLEVRSAEVQRWRAEVALVQAENAAATAVLSLSQTVGIPLPEDVALTSEFAVFEPAWDADGLVARALESNPTLLAARSSASAAGSSVTSARSSYLPTFNVNVGWSGSVYEAANTDPLVRSSLMEAERGFAQCQEQNVIRSSAGLAPVTCLNPADPAVAAGIEEAIRQQNSGFPFDYTPQPMNAGVTVSLPLFTGFSRRLQIDQAQAAAADANYRVRAEELRLRQEVASAAGAVRAAYRTELLQRQVIESATEELRLAEERFRQGAANAVEVTDAQTNLAQAERDLIEAVFNFHQSLAALEALVGEPLRNQ